MKQLTDDHEKISKAEKAEFNSIITGLQKELKEIENKSKGKNKEDQETNDNEEVSKAKHQAIVNKLTMEARECKTALTNLEADLADKEEVESKLRAELFQFAANTNTNINTNPQLNSPLPPSPPAPQSSLKGTTQSQSFPSPSFSPASTFSRNIFKSSGLATLSLTLVADMVASALRSKDVSILSEALSSLLDKYNGGGPRIAPDAGCDRVYVYWQRVRRSTPA